MPGSLLKVCYATSSQSTSTSQRASTPVDAEADALTTDELIAALEINPDLCNEDNSDKGLIYAYTKWKAITEAYKKMQTMTWNGPKPTYSAIIGLFVSTSMFYSHYKHFNKAVKHPDMVEWLEARKNGPSDMDIWGKEKPYYTFTDLAKWLKEAGDGPDLESSDGGKKKSKKGVTKKKVELKDSGKSHKGKSKSSEVSKKGSKK